MKIYKPKFWDNRAFTIWPYFLLPFSLIINLVNFLRFKFIKKENFNIPIILVGNIYLGGTGKTPLCREIFMILKSLNAKPAFVKKYYAKHNDETKLLEKTGMVFSDKSRSKAIKQLINSKEEIAILDDGFQDPTIDSDISIVCFNEKQWTGNGFVIPSGPLRENLVALKRCDYVFINGNENLEIEKNIKEINSNINIFYTHYTVINLKDIKNKKFLAFSGIANPVNFLDLLKKNDIEIAKSINFPDHYNFKKNDILNLKKKAKELDLHLITTEKNFVRLDDEDKKNINYLKIELVINKKEKFINELAKVI